MGATSLTEILLSLASVGFLVVLNGFFVAAEFAIVKIRETQLAPLIAKGHKRAAATKRILGNLDSALSATQLGITLASLGLGWVGEPVFEKVLSPLANAVGITSPEMKHRIAFGVGFTAITFLHIVTGELVPKWIAIRKPMHIALWVAQPLEWFRKLSTPLIWALKHSALWVLRVVGIQPVSESEMVHSQEELRLMVTASQKHAGSTSLGRAVVLNALDLNRRQARDVMRPRREITSLDTEATIAQCLDIAEKTRYSRFPLCRDGDLDQTLGVVHFKDLFAMRLRIRTAAELTSVARKLIYVPASCRLEKLLQLFLDRKLHLAIVVDEYGGTLGLVSLENILEELVGQIQDEFDQERPLLQRKTADTWEIDGTLPLHELEELVGERLEEPDIATTSGYITQKRGGFPTVGDRLQIGNFELRVEEMDGPTVSRLTARRLPAPPPAEGFEGGAD
jgi:CBS domain containing-hemolysin-like protein